MIVVTVDVHSLVIGSPSGPIHIVVLPVHSPASLASSSCILPGVPASMQACMSSMVQPLGSLKSAGRPVGLSSFACATVRAASAAMPAAATIEASNFLRFIGGLQKMNEGFESS